MLLWVEVMPTVWTFFTMLLTTYALWLEMFIVIEVYFHIDITNNDIGKYYLSTMIAILMCINSAKIFISVLPYLVNLIS